MNIRAKLLNYETDNMRSNLDSLFTTIASLGDSKLMQDEMEAKIIHINRKNYGLIDDFNKIKEKLKDLNFKLADKDRAIKIMEQKCERIKGEKDRYASIFKEKNALLDKDREEAKESKRNAVIEVVKLRSVIAKKTREIEALKLKNSKLRTRKVVDSTNSKMCVNCGLEFSEKDNYNWSCSVHNNPEYDMDGGIWWCCGKRNINAPGCKK